MMGSEKRVEMEGKEGAIKRDRESVHFTIDDQASLRYL